MQGGINPSSTAVATSGGNLSFNPTFENVVSTEENSIPKYAIYGAIVLAGIFILKKVV